MATSNGNKRPPTYDHLRSKKKPTIRKVMLSMDSEVEYELWQAQQEFGMAEMMLQSAEGTRAQDPDRYADQEQKYNAAKERLKKAEKAAEEDAIEFVFKSIGRKAYDDLVAAHPPTDKNRKEIEKQGGDPDQMAWNPDTFPAALIAASIVKPDLTGEQVQEMWESDDWGIELETLLTVALSAQQSRRVVEVGNV